MPIKPNRPRINLAPAINKRSNKENSKHPEKLTTVVEDGRHEQRLLLIHKNPNPDRAFEQNPQLRPKRSLIIITTRNIAAFVNMQNAMYLSPKPVIQATGSNRHLSICSTGNRIPETALFCHFAFLPFFFFFSLEFSADLGL
jgi:hypothetical protein